MASSNHPALTSLSDVTISTLYEDDQYLCHSFVYLTLDDEAWYGRISKKGGATDMPTLDEVNKHLYHVEDANIYPEKPSSITVVPCDLEKGHIHIKRPGFMSHNENIPDFWSKVLLHEASIMEQIPAHPNVITYYGCSVHRGRITGIVLERLEKTLMRSSHVAVANIDAFLPELQSAVDHLHSLGLAHNDINPYNIMIKDGHPILIDFGGCTPLGHLVDLCGSLGWCEKPFFRSETEHDTYGMNKLRKWLENGGKEERQQPYLNPAAFETCQLLHGNWLQTCRI